MFDDFKNLTNSTSSRGKISSFLEKMFNLGNRERDRKGEGEGGEREGERKRGIKSVGRKEQTDVKDCISDSYSTQRYT